MAGGRCKVNTTSFSNDMSIINNKDDVFTVLIHLGYLSYDREREECYIPNKEVGREMINAVNANKWTVVSNALAASEELLNSTLAGDEESVAAGIEKVHDAETAIRQILEKNYVGVLTDYVGDVLLVGINYDKKSKKHSCKIQRYQNS